MSGTIIPLQNGQLPAGFCPATLQDMLAGFTAEQFITLTLGQGTGIQVQSNRPSNTTLPWLQLDSNGNPVRIYWFANGAWLSLHPQATGFAMPYFDALPTTYVGADGHTYLSNFDGGDASGVPSPLSGPMWEVVTAMAAKFPMGAGTLPSTKVVNNGDTGGEENHVLLDTELAQHRHYLANTDFGSGDSGTPLANNNQMNQGSGGDSKPLNYSLTGSNNPAVLGLSSLVGSNVGHNTLPPYLGMNWLRRTARVYYAVP